VVRAPYSGVGHLELQWAASLHKCCTAMTNLRISDWRKLPVSLAELCIDTTLRCGQSFRWRKLKDKEWYVERVVKKKDIYF